jgi:hypothetical protein
MKSKCLVAAAAWYVLRKLLLLLLFYTFSSTYDQIFIIYAICLQLINNST